DLAAGGSGDVVADTQQDAPAGRDKPVGSCVRGGQDAAAVQQVQVLPAGREVRHGQPHVAACRGGPQHVQRITDLGDVDTVVRGAVQAPAGGSVRVDGQVVVRFPDPAAPGNQIDVRGQDRGV